MARALRECRKIKVKPRVRWPLVGQWAIALQNRDAFGFAIGDGLAIPKHSNPLHFVGMMYGRQIWLGLLHSSSSKVPSCPIRERWVRKAMRFVAALTRLIVYILLYVFRLIQDVSTLDEASPVPSERALTYGPRHNLAHASYKQFSCSHRFVKEAVREYQNVCVMG
jgi:hypothetical protein